MFDFGYFTNPFDDFFFFALDILVAEWYADTLQWSFP